MLMVVVSVVGWWIDFLVLDLMVSGVWNVVSVVVLLLLELLGIWLRFYGLWVGL